MPDGFLSPPRNLRFGHRWVTVSPNLISPDMRRHRFGHLKALLSRSATQLTLPKFSTENLSAGWAMLPPIARSDRECQHSAGLHLLTSY